MSLSSRMMESDEKWEAVVFFGKRILRKRPIRGSVAKKCPQQVALERERNMIPIGERHSRLEYAPAIPLCYRLAEGKKWPSESTPDNSS